MSLLQILCLKLLKHRNQVYVQFYTDFPLLENLSKTKINIVENVPKNLIELNALANTLLKFSNQDSFSGLKNFEILAKDGTFFMRISKTPSFYIFEIFLQVSKYFIGTWYRDSELIFVQIS